MDSTLDMDFILATNNAHKLKEFENALGGRVFRAQDFGIYDFNPIEDGNSFEDNARIKALALYEALRDLDSLESKKTFPKKLVILADDSGLCVEALGGMPGIFSARYANLDSNIKSSENSSDSDNRERLKTELLKRDLWGSKAYFQCSIAYIFCDSIKSILDSKAVKVVNGICDGIVSIKMVGNQGFGYDSMFYKNIDSNKIDFSIKNTDKILENLTNSLATLSLNEKMQISHRGNALKKLKEELESTLRN